VQHSVTNWHVDRNAADAWQAICDELNLIAAHAAGFRSARVLRSIEHPGKFVIYACWESREAWNAYYADARVQALVHSAFRLLKGPPVQEWFEVAAEAEAATTVRSALTPSG